MNLKTIMPYENIFTAILITIALTALVTYLLCRPVNNVLPTTPVKEIVQQTEDKARPLEKSIDSLTKVYQKSKDSITVLKFKWLSAVAENKRLREIKASSYKPPVDINKPAEEILNIDELGNIRNGNAEDFITATQIAAQLADSLCAETIGAMEHREAIADSLYQSQKTISEILRHGFNNLAQQSQLKDAAIKNLNRQLKWQKVQATGLKVAAIAIAAIVIKNQFR